MTATPIRLLVLEDNLGDAVLVEEALADFAPGGFIVTRAERLVDALARLAVEPFEAMLCDLSLPDSSGMETIQTIAKHFPALALVVLTGSHDATIGNDTIQYGAQDYLTKGKSAPEVIARTLHYAIERKSLQNALVAANSALEQRVAERTAELSRVNQVLESGLKRYQAVTRTATDAIITADAQGNIEDWNAGATLMFGHERAEVIGKALTLLIPQRFRDGHLGGMERVQAGGERHVIGKTVEMAALRKDGSECPAELTLSEWTVDGNQHFTGFIRDISERKQAEHALAQESLRNKAYLRNASDGVHILDADGKVLEISDSFCTMLGYSRKELIGANVSLWDAQWSAPGLQLALAALIAQEDRSVFETRHRRKDGTIFDVEICGQRLELNGKTRLFNSARDVTDKKRAEHEILHTMQQLETAFMSTVEVATLMSEIRDPYTAGHMRRVGALAAAIGVELGFDERRQQGLKVAGHLHDIGKIGVPSEILSMPGRLSPLHLKLVQEHSQAGFNILKGVEFPWPLAQVAMQHHERMDGSGYPQGLRGEAILLDARIVAVADVVEAMSSHRPYRAALGLEKALAEIERGRGTSFDPTVVDACLKLFREKEYTIAE